MSAHLLDCAAGRQSFAYLAERDGAAPTVSVGVASGQLSDLPGLLSVSLLPRKRTCARLAQSVTKRFEASGTAQRVFVETHIQRGDISRERAALPLPAAS